MASNGGKGTAMAGPAAAATTAAAAPSSSHPPPPPPPSQLPASASREPVTTATAAATTTSTVTATATAAATPTATPKSKRVLACVLCQQRKVKCNRKFPCSNCVRAGAQCVPAAPHARQRPRRRGGDGGQGERELLERLRRYEELLGRNQIAFEPMGTGASKAGGDGNGDGDGDGERNGNRNGDGDGDGDKDADATMADDAESTNGTPAADRRAHVPDRAEPRDDNDDDSNHGNDNGSDNDDDDDDDDADLTSNASQDRVREVAVKRVLSSFLDNNDGLLLGAQKSAASLMPLHPQQVQIFKLWQVYLDNVNPLLKVTHTPTLQARIIDAAANLSAVGHTMEALMFSIYCLAVLSLDDGECLAAFNSPKKDLLASYRYGCQQALMNEGFLRTSDRDCLTAFYLYLQSVRPDTDPRSLSPMLGVAVRIAQRMGIHSEPANMKCAPLEAEMRRRLWWSLIIFDTRVSEMCDAKPVILDPTWDCRAPVNVNDFDLSPEMKVPPEPHERPTEAIFVVVRSELADFIRYRAFHLDFINPVLKSVVRGGGGGGGGGQPGGDLAEGGGEELATMERDIEDRYLKACNPENPLHCATQWIARGYMAKNRLMEFYSRKAKPSVSGAEADAQRDEALAHALDMLECDTKLMTSPHSKRYFWLLEVLQFPFLAYVHAIQDLKRRPDCGLASRAWQALSDNYALRYTVPEPQPTPFFKIFSKIVLQAWAARSSAAAAPASSGKQDESDAPTSHTQTQPLIVSDIKQRIRQHKALASEQQPGETPGLSSAGAGAGAGGGSNSDDLSFSVPTPAPMDFGIPGAMPFGFGMGADGGPGIGMGMGMGMGNGVPDLTDGFGGGGGGGLGDGSGGFGGAATQDPMDVGLDQFDWPDVTGGMDATGNDGQPMHFGWGGRGGRRGGRGGRGGSFGRHTHGHGGGGHYHHRHHHSPPPPPPPPPPPHHQHQYPWHGAGGFHGLRAAHYKRMWMLRNLWMQQGQGDGLDMQQPLPQTDGLGVQPLQQSDGLGVQSMAQTDGLGVQQPQQQQQQQPLQQQPLQQQPLQQQPLQQQAPPPAPSQPDMEPAPAHTPAAAPPSDS